MNGSEGFLPKNQNFTMKAVQVLWFCPIFVKEPAGWLTLCLKEIHWFVMIFVYFHVYLP